MNVPTFASFFVLAVSLVFTPLLATTGFATEGSSHSSNPDQWQFEVTPYFHVVAREGADLGAMLGAGIGLLTGGDAKGAMIGMGVGAMAGGFDGKKIGQNMDEQEAALRKQLADVEAAEMQRNAEVLAIIFRSDYWFDVDSAVLKAGADDEVQRVVVTISPVES